MGLFSMWKRKKEEKLKKEKAERIEKIELERAELEIAIKKFELGQSIQNAEFEKTKRTERNLNQCMEYIVELVDTIAVQVKSEQYKLYLGTKMILNRKAQRVDYNDNLYIDVLKCNILFYLNSMGDIKNILIKDWFLKNEISEDYILKVKEIQNENKISELIQNKTKNINKLNKFADINIYDIIYNLEAEYMYQFMYSTIFYEILSPKNIHLLKSTINKIKSTDITFTEQQFLKEMSKKIEYHARLFSLNTFI